jgi:hypothetical protein
MPNANDKIDVVNLVSDALHELNMTLASILPNEPGYDDLELKRDEVEAKLKRLVRGFFGDNTRRFISAGDQLVEINRRMRADLRSLQNMKATIDSIANLVNALDGFIGTVFPLPA